jgi:hypothetical protein
MQAIKLFSLFHGRTFDQIKTSIFYSSGSLPKARKVFLSKRKFHTIDCRLQFELVLTHFFHKIRELIPFVDMPIYDFTEKIIYLDN